MLPGCSAAQPPAQDAPEHEDPHEQADRQQHLPEPGEVEVLEALQPEPVRGRVLQHAVDAEVGADQRPEHDDGQRAEQREGELALVPGLAPGDHRRQEDPGGDERGRHPEQRELDVPGAHQVVGEDLRQVEAEEARRSRRGSAGEAAPTSVWIRNSAAITKKNHARRALRRRERDVAGRAEATASPARGRASRGCGPSARRRRTAGRCRPAARSATAPTRRSRWRSACCRRAARAASCSCRSSCGPGRLVDAAHAVQAKNAVSWRSCVRIGDRVGPQAVLGRRVGEEAAVVRRRAGGTPRPAARSASASRVRLS